jgi:hypothetical protein
MSEFSLIHTVETGGDQHRRNFPHGDTAGRRLYFRRVRALLPAQIRHARGCNDFYRRVFFDPAPQPTGKAYSAIVALGAGLAAIFANSASYPGSAFDKHNLRPSVNKPGRGAASSETASYYQNFVQLKPGLAIS